MINLLLILLGKILSRSINILNLGNGSTWPGHIALKINPHFIREMAQRNKLKIIMIAGTNGKTTTSKMIKSVLETSGKRVIHNLSGANLLNGLASTILLNASITGKLTHDYAIFEIDENMLPLALKEITPDFLLLLNLFRDQLDRYGEVRTIATKWLNALSQIPERTKLLMNADDPVLVFLSSKAKSDVSFFGLTKGDKDQTEHSHAADTLYCPKCGEKLQYSIFFLSHLGIWTCPSCHLTHPNPDIASSSFYPLAGTYNEYNTLAAVLLTTFLGLTQDQIERGLRAFTPAFGRQEKIVRDGKTIQLFLSKNPTGLNESLKTIKEAKAKYVLFVLNDRIADGHDVSWIWDVDFEEFITDFKQIMISGNRVYDMALRIKYSDKKITTQIYETVTEAILMSVKVLPQNETLYILPTYTAMLEVRKILTGKHIL